LLLLSLLVLGFLFSLREGPSAVGARRGRRRSGDGRGRGRKRCSFFVGRSGFNVAAVVSSPSLRRRQQGRGRRRRRRRGRLSNTVPFPPLARRLVFPSDLSFLRLPPLLPQVRRRQRSTRDRPTAEQHESPRGEERGPRCLGPEFVSRGTVGDEDAHEKGDFAEAEEEEPRAREEEGRGLDEDLVERKRKNERESFCFPRRFVSVSVTPQSMTVMKNVSIEKLTKWFPSRLESAKYDSCSTSAFSFLR